MKYCGKCDNGWVPGFLGAMKIPCECTKTPALRTSETPEAATYYRGAPYAVNRSVVDEAPTVDKWREAELDGRRRRADQLIPGLNNAFQGLSTEKFLKRCSPADLESAEALQKRWLEEFPETRWFFESPEDLRRRAEKLRDRLRATVKEKTRLTDRLVDAVDPFSRTQPTLTHEGFFTVKVLSHERRTTRLGNERAFLTYQITEVLECEADEQLTGRTYHYIHRCRPSLLARATVGTELRLRTEKKKVARSAHTFMYHHFLQPSLRVLQPSLRDRLRPTLEAGRALDRLIVDRLLNARGQDAALRANGWEWVPATLSRRGRWTHVIKDDCFELQLGKNVSHRIAYNTEHRRARERLGEE